MIVPEKQLSEDNFQLDVQLKYYQPQKYWDQLVYLFIRPPRCIYDNTMICYFFQIVEAMKSCNVPPVFVHKLEKIPFNKNFISLSLIQKITKPKYTILYCHGNSSCKLQMFTLWKEFYNYFYEQKNNIEGEIGLASFDFEGCGITDAQFISLGFNQAKQISQVVNWLQKRQSKVILWGRSMGATSVIKCGGSYINILDSPFSNVKLVSKQFLYNVLPWYTRCVLCCFPCAFCCLEQQIKQRFSFDFSQELNLIDQMKKANPKKAFFFMAGIKDKLIQPHHSQDLCETCPGIKQLIVFNGQHNDRRQRKTLEFAFKFIEKNYNNQI